MPAPWSYLCLQYGSDGSTLQYSTFTVVGSTSMLASDAVGNSFMEPVALFEPAITAGTTSQYWRGDKTWQTLATVGTTGAYSDLSGKPTLGTAASRNTSAFDSSGAASAAQAFAIQRANQTGTQAWSTITSTPTSLSGYGIIDGVSSSGSYANPSWITLLPFSKITGTPTTLAGYGITDAYPLSGNPSSFTTVAGARGAITLTTTGTSGSATYNSSTGVVNIPTYANSGGTVTSVGVTGSDFSISGSPITTSGSIAMALAASGVTAGTYSSVTVTAKGIVTAGTARSFNNASVRSISTTNNTANGFQLSTTQDAHVTYPVTVTTTTTIGGPSAGTVVLEICSTNNATGSAWTTIGTFTNSNTAALAVVLSLVCSNTANIIGIVPAGYFARIRSGSATGTVSFSTTSTGQECLL